MKRFIIYLILFLGIASFIGSKVEAKPFDVEHKFDNTKITLFTKNGMVKRVELKDLEVSRYSKPVTCMKLKEGDEVVSVSRCDGEYILAISKDGYALKYSTSEAPILKLVE